MGHTQQRGLGMDDTKESQKEGPPHKRRQGRPRRSDAVASVVVTVRLTPEEAVALDALRAAFGRGLSRAQTLRLCMAAVKESMTPATPQT